MAKPGPLTYGTAAFEVLRRKRPEALHYARILDEAIRRGWLRFSGSTPDQTMLATLRRDPRFRRHAPGLYGLSAAGEALDESLAR